MTARIVLLASQAIQPPLVGCLHESPSVMRCVYGVAGAFILGPALVRPDEAPIFTKTAGLPDGARLSLESGELVIARPDGRIDRTPAPPSALAIEPMGDGWFHLAGARRIFRVNAGQIVLFVLPREVRR